MRFNANATLFSIKHQDQDVVMVVEGEVKQLNHQRLNIQEAFFYPGPSTAKEAPTKAAGKHR